VPLIVDHEFRRRQVAAVAARLIADSGLEAVTVRDVAQAAGCSTAIVSHYFHNKRELLLFTYRYSIEASTALSDRSLGPGGDNLKAYISALMPFDDERRMNWKIWFAFWAKAVADEEFAVIQRDCVRRTRGHIQRILDGLHREGQLVDGVDRAYEARRLLVIIMGMAVQVVFDEEDWTIERQLAFIEHELSAFLRPIGSPALELVSQDSE
jgi:AcrR family transcriptional regulator